MMRPILAAFLAPFLLLGTTVSEALAAPIPQADALSDLKHEVDRSVRWLRGTQNPATGSYGTGVEGTSWALWSLAYSPRKYERADGPFVAKALDFLLARQAPDGSIADEGAADDAKLDQTRLAAIALSSHAGPTTAAALGRAAKWLGQQGVDSPTLATIEFEANLKEATRVGLELMARRKDDASFDGERGAVIETARAIEALARVGKVLSPAQDTSGLSTVALPKFTPATVAEIDASLVRAARFLLATGDGARWGAPGQPDVGMTAMVVGALQEVPRPRPKDIQLAIDDARAWIATHQKPDGSIHQGRLANYVTSASIMALAEEESYRERVLRARDWLIGLQADEGEGYSDGDLYYGGIGYGNDERPDLSNLQMSLEALVAAGTDKDHPAFQKALQFMQRCQNRSESNDLELTRKGIVIKAGDDGGAGYAPGESKAGFVKLEDGSEVPRSYGSMTYALLKGLVFAGLQKEDPRVKACWEWLSKNYTLDVNPGFDAAGDPRAPYQGLFYYFDTMAKALDVYGEDVIVDANGVKHDWRAELAGRLIAMQSKADGSWVNVNAERWWEGNPVLASAYAMQALGAARK